MPGLALQSFWFGTLGTLGTIVLDGTLLVFPLDPLVHLHLTFAGVVCILSLKGRQEHCPFTTRLRGLKLAQLEYATIHNNIVTWFKNDLRLPVPRINLLKCYRGDHGGCPIQKGLQACLKRWLHQNSFARQ
jgi:hypothetical protein